jgi:tRNA dimethylallyltransferase
VRVTNPVLIVAGPTASGKSGLALAVAEAFDGIVINADSMQVYRELRVLSARPEHAALARAPHRLYGILSVTEPCSAGHWCRLARAEIAAAYQESKLPIVVGGTGLYLQSLVEGIVQLPDVPPELRARARAHYDAIGPEAFHRELAARDPDTAHRLRPRDRQRLVRAWEVLEATGRPLARLQREATEPPPAALKFAAILLDPPRTALYAAIERRFDAMIRAGALDEVAAVLAQTNDPDLPALRAVGVPELARCLRGDLALDEAVPQAKQATRRYAKRQVTWFRHHRLAPDMLTVEELLTAQLSESLRSRIFNFIRHHLLTEAH